MKNCKAFLVVTVLLLSGCSTVSDMFEDSNDTVLPGERISVLQLQKDLVPSPELSSKAIVLPDTWVNQFWPQAGGYPNHAMGHLALPAKLKKAPSPTSMTVA